MTDFKFIYIILLVIGLSLMFYAFEDWSKITGLLRTGHKTNAKVIELLRVESKKGILFQPILEYKNEKGKLLQFTSKVRSNPSRYKLDELVPIILKGDEISILSFWELYLTTIIMLCLAMPALVIGGGYVLFHYL